MVVFVIQNFGSTFQIGRAEKEFFDRHEAKSWAVRQPLVEALYILSGPKARRATLYLRKPGKRLFLNKGQVDWPSPKQVLRDYVSADRIARSIIERRQNEAV